MVRSGEDWVGRNDQERDYLRDARLGICTLRTGPLLGRPVRLQGLGLQSPEENVRFAMAGRGQLVATPMRQLAPTANSRQRP